jgi:creatinine deaminase
MMPFKLLIVRMSDLSTQNYQEMMAVALAEARLGLAEGGVPVGAALFASDGSLLGRGRNRRVQENDPSIHGETDAFRKAGRQKTYQDKILVTTLSPCWYCCGLVRQFKIGLVIVGDSQNFVGGAEWLRQNGTRVIDLEDAECVQMMRDFISLRPDLWNEDIGS